MTPDQYQKACRRFDNHSIGHKAQAAVLGLCAEAGEVANLVERSLRSQNDGSIDHDELMLELGDVLWNVARLADLYGFTFSSLMDANINKLTARYAEAGLEVGQ